MCFSGPLRAPERVLLPFLSQNASLGLSAQGCTLHSFLALSVQSFRILFLVRAFRVVLGPDPLRVHPGPPRGDCMLAFLCKTG